jgi:hypothetical protein
MRPSLLVWPDEGSVGGVALTLSIGTTPLLGAVTAGDFLVTDGNSGGDGTNLVERYFIYNPAGVAMGNVYTDWATMFAAIALLPIGEMPVVSVVDITGLPVPVPLAGMPVNGWDMRGGSIVSFYRATGQVTLDALPGVKFDMLLEIGNGLVLTVAPPANTGVLEFSLIPDSGPFVFTIGLGATVINNGAGALIRSRGNLLSTGTYVLLLFGSAQGSIFPPLPGPGPIVELTGDDGVVLSQQQTLGGMPIAPLTRWLAGGSAASVLIVITDASGTSPTEWTGPAFLGTTFVYPTMRNGLSGTTLERPLIAFLPVGTTFFDTTIGFPIWWNGLIWVDAAGAPA